MEYTEDQLTEWFDIEKEKPSAEGVYIVKSKDIDLDCQTSLFKDGAFHEICVVGVDVTECIAENGIGDGITVTHWRGLNFNPNAPKPKKGNKRKTMYCVIDTGWGYPNAVFDSLKNARDYASNAKKPLRIRKIRFRTPEHD